MRLSRLPKLSHGLVFCHVDSGIHRRFVIGHMHGLATGVRDMKFSKPDVLAVTLITAITTDFDLAPGEARIGAEQLFYGGNLLVEVRGDFRSNQVIRLLHTDVHGRTIIHAHMKTV